MISGIPVPVSGSEIQNADPDLKGVKLAKIRK
jgi:hypothetical protein